MLKSERLMNVKPHEIPRLAPWLKGRFYYSATQRVKLDSEGHDRMFMQTRGNQCDILEYTEFIDEDMLKENPGELPMFNDAVFLGPGRFHSMKDM